MLVTTLVKDLPIFLIVSIATLTKDPLFILGVSVTTFIMVIYLVATDVSFTFQKGLKTCQLDNLHSFY